MVAASLARSGLLARVLSAACCLGVEQHQTASFRLPPTLVLVLASSLVCIPLFSWTMGRFMRS